MYFVYLIQCGDGTFYAGIAKDVERRFLEHQAGKGARYTRARKVVKVLYAEKYNSVSGALKREAQIKGWRREKKLNLIKFGKPII
ncbi:MAG: hypothetical protein A3I26_03225 [Candidatus Yanofskybacteria bacterium RIFCSPLOWO2_02_FULL_43_10]|uniref:GIY-YIG domain-containing protein n=1 Tax=Candidatus Yanofskybacteria bacterium RIFCSPLOWO2_12_FULL_43_11b TaxID=1802710 RepID=A0A1F8H6J7_9BACT|nr:MAG: hypothetical protein A2742_01455 [Candidatus Yanofskybacteria bacterium RIFCSPHIGHO2_01_FULL_43_32]OGN12002.1 MAG: hypothetical protein A3C69_02990 [Candidatus Yanofskybacteria bacterium RIFCSPHIGHO2_02_FULL_43_12]OGN17830.1 MAG: hypothetical protein A3E34_01190 [Candidatus Yanofskybacteria bacterium RIFCSPHIGHO2_12_FULL_43_11]OGN24788.1 MAG: hypothetical protein A2923_03145 [Candidatus Yanofskybacteria bacterium RIFCSPLOWO2_01_FULL_43_46]OGN28963.1 MAG: hypothetical protein A3I26_03225